MHIDYFDESCLTQLYLIVRLARRMLNFRLVVTID